MPGIPVTVHAVFVGEKDEAVAPPSVQEAWDDFDRTVRATLVITSSSTSEFDAVVFASSLQRSLGSGCQGAGCGRVQDLKARSGTSFEVAVWAESSNRPKQVAAKLMALLGCKVAGYLVQTSIPRPGLHAAY